MSFIKTSLLNGIAVIIKMVTLLCINKILAIYTGPAGYAAIGQFQNAIQMITTFASGAMNTGVTKYTAEYHEDDSKQHLVWQTAGTIVLLGSILTSLAIAFLNKQLAHWFLKDTSFGGVFHWFAATLVFFTINSLLLAILNGKKDIVRYVLANISGSIFALIITAALTINNGIYGALVALAIYQSITFLTTLLLCCNAPWFKIKYIFGRIDKNIAINLSKFTAIALTSAASVPLSHIIIRNHLGENFGWIAAGYWEAMWRLSSAYILVGTTTLSVYYLPKFAETICSSTIRKEVIQGYKIILPAAIIACAMMYYLRDFIVSSLFSNDFYEMRILFQFQVIGDFFKVASWVLGYVFISKARFRLCMFIEVFFSIQFVLMTYILTSYFGVQGVTVAHASNYLLCFLFVLIIFLKSYKNDAKTLD